MIIIQNLLKYIPSHNAQFWISGDNVQEETRGGNGVNSYGASPQDT